MERLNPGADGGAPQERWDLAEYALSFAADRPVSASRLVSRCYGFAVANRHFLLEDGQAAELVSQPLFTPLPNSPEHCLGLANVRGNIVPYYSIRTLLEPSLEQAHESHHYALLLGDVIHGVLLAIDAKPTAVSRDLLVQNTQPLSNLGELPSSVFKSRCSAMGNDWRVLDCPKFLTFLASGDADI